MKYFKRILLAAIIMSVAGVAYAKGTKEASNSDAPPAPEKKEVLPRVVTYSPNVVPHPNMNAVESVRLQIEQEERNLESLKAEAGIINKRIFENRDMKAQAIIAANDKVRASETRLGELRTKAAELADRGNVAFFETSRTVTLENSRIEYERALRQAEIDFNHNRLTVGDERTFTLARAEIALEHAKTTLKQLEASTPRTFNISFNENSAQLKLLGAAGLHLNKELLLAYLDTEILAREKELGERTIDLANIVEVSRQPNAPAENVNSFKNLIVREIARLGQELGQLRQMRTIVEHGGNLGAYTDPAPQLEAPKPDTNQQSAAPRSEPAEESVSQAQTQSVQDQPGKVSVSPSPVQVLYIRDPRIPEIPVDKLTPYHQERLKEHRRYATIYGGFLSFEEYEAELAKYPGLAEDVEAQFYLEVRPRNVYLEVRQRNGR